MLAGGTLPRTGLTIPRPALLSASAGREPVVAVRAAELAYAGTAVLDGLDITVRRHVILVTLPVYRVSLRLFAVWRDSDPLSFSSFVTES